MAAELSFVQSVLSYLQMRACARIAQQDIYFLTVQNIRCRMTIRDTTQTLGAGIGFTFFLFLLLIFPVQGALTDNLIAVWRLNNTLDDSFGNFTLSNSGSAINAVGFLNYSADFENIPVNNHQYLKTTADSRLKLDKNFTVKAWVKPESFNDVNNVILQNSYYNASGYYYGWVFGLRGNGSIQFFGGTGDNSHFCTYIAGKGFDVGKWTMATLVYHKDVGANSWYALYNNGTMAWNQSCTYDVKFNDTTYFGMSFGSGFPETGTSAPFDGLLDEVAVWNRSLTNAEILRIFQNESNDLGYNWTQNPPYSLLDLNILSPLNNSHQNDNLSVSFILNSTSVFSNCSLYIDSMINTSLNTSNNTVTYLTALGKGTENINYSYYINCSDSTNNNISSIYSYSFDSLNPVVSILQPNPTYIYGYQLPVSCQASDSYLFEVNETIRNTSSVIYTSTATGLTNTSYNSMHNLDISLWTQGIYNYTCEAGDSHTGASFTDAYSVSNVRDDKKELTLDTAKLDFTTSEGVSLTFEKETDRLNFLLEDKSGRMEIEKEIIIKSDYPFTKVNKDYPCHYVTSDYWIDCSDLPGAIDSQIDKYTIVFRYRAESEIIRVDSVGGLNRANTSELFTVDRFVSVSNFTSPAMGFQNGTITISMGTCNTTYDSVISSYNVSLLKSDYSFNQTISNDLILSHSFDTSTVADGNYRLSLVCCNNYTLCNSTTTGILQFGNTITANPVIVTDIINLSILGNSTWNPSVECRTGSPLTLDFSYTFNTEPAVTGLIESNTTYPLSFGLGLGLNNLLLNCSYNSTEYTSKYYTVIYTPSAAPSVNNISLSISLELLIFMIFAFTLLILGFMYQINILIMLSAFSWIFTGLSYVSNVPMKILFVFLGAILFLIWSRMSFFNSELGK
jgi:hypothetical protein